MTPLGILVIVSVWRSCATSKYEMPHTSALINGKAYRVPKNRSHLPFVNQMRRFAIQKQ